MGPRGAPGDGLPGEKVETAHICKWLHALSYITFTVAEIACFHAYTHRVIEAFLEHVERGETRDTMENLDLLDQW